MNKHYIHLKLNILNFSWFYTKLIWEWDKKHWKHKDRKTAQHWTVWTGNFFLMFAFLDVTCFIWAILTIRSPIANIDLRCVQVDYSQGNMCFITWLMHWAVSHENKYSGHVLLIQISAFSSAPLAQSALPSHTCNTITSSHQSYLSVSHLLPENTLIVSTVPATASTTAQGPGHSNSNQQTQW